MITGEELRRARLEIGWTQDQLADTTGFSPRQICRLEHDTSLIKINNYLKLLKALQIVKYNEEEE